MTTATAVRERPILFSDRLVRAILDGRKTQTRRPLKVQPEPTYAYGDGNTGMILREQPFDWQGRKYWRYGAHWGSQPRFDAPFPACPFGAPGDRLWVREAWGTVRMRELGQFIYGDGRIPDRDRIVYRAGRRVLRSEDRPTSADAEWPASWSDDFKPERWRPSIHMPRWASRISLEVTDVRVERLRDMVGVDAEAEGVKLDFPGGHHGAFARAREEFGRLWDEHYAGTPNSWDANPWVWVVSFRRLEP